MTPLPLVAPIRTSEDSTVAAGHDCRPYVFYGNESGWRLIGGLDRTSFPKSVFIPPQFIPVGTRRLNSADLDTFKDADSRGLSSTGGGGGSSQGESELFTVYQNTITSVRPRERQSEAITEVSTTGVDGKLVVWNLGAVTAVTEALERSPPLISLPL